ncbi:peptidase [Sphingomonas sp. HDW15A]|uniref:A24 family peptidase n=1 Tax=Sphingomonas sp. HDW15A TaxID=2714942 RepID=UPI00140E10C9|nr:prepilin peptidase [Sphingomonas sp. HDW15A]QIK96233.1 peptidase [Sphingomonas sp. HDW15A]
MMNDGFTLALMAVLALLLIVAALIDVRTFTISNRLNAAIALMAPIYWWSIQLPLWPDGAIRVGVACLVFALLAVTFFIGMMGGGDVKLAAALALWFQPWETARFIVYMSIAGGLLTIIVMWAHRRWPGWQVDEQGQSRAKPEVPYGVAIAIGALVILAQRFLNHFA